METRAPHLVIGIFVLLFVAGIFGFVIWLAKTEIDKEYAYYRIPFEGAVSGLSVGGDVRFNGILVGRVAQIRIDPNDPKRVLVRIEVDRETPVRADTVASLEFQGITGVSFVQLSGGSPSSPMLAAAPGAPDPEIPAIKSAIQELFAGAPELINRVIVLVDQLTRMVDEDNRRAIANILANADHLSGSLAARTPEIERIVKNFDQSAGQVRATLEQTNKLVGRLNAMADSVESTLAVTRRTLASVDSLVDQDARKLVQDFRRTAGNLEKMSGEMAGLLTENREAVDVFLGQGTVDFTRFMQEARLLVAAATRLVDDVQNDPARFLFGRAAGGVNAP